MGERRRPSGKSNSSSRPRDDAEERFPTNAELLGDLTNYGEKRRREPREIPAISRRTRDYLLTAGIGSAIIVAAIVKVVPESDGVSIARLAFTGAALFCGLLWYIFYGVMSRY